MSRNLHSKKDVRNMLKDSGLHFKKSLGQNFLTDVSVLDDIVSASDITKDDYVLEIGPGPGVLTKELAKNAKHVVCVELDSDIISLLSENVKEYDKTRVDFYQIFTRVFYLHLRGVIDKQWKN